MNDVIRVKENLLSLAFDRLSEKYPSGLYEWMYKYRQETEKERMQLEDEINNNFRTKGSISELKAILRAYWALHMKAIKAFKESSIHDSSLEEIRDERIEELETTHA